MVNVKCPGGGDSTMEKLVPSDAALLPKQHLDSIWVRVFLVVNGVLLSNRVKALP